MTTRTETSQPAVLPPIGYFEIRCFDYEIMHFPFQTTYMKVQDSNSQGICNAVAAVKSMLGHGGG